MRCASSFKSTTRSHADDQLPAVGRRAIGRTVLARFLQENSIQTVAFDDAHATAALDAYSRFGKGRHRAALNFGDCCTYAIASVASEPLLCLGDDFAQTDLLLVSLGTEENPADGEASGTAG
jgi:uncharacterized protein with PIN domain